jgi:hypothetical protein
MLPGERLEIAAAVAQALTAAERLDEIARPLSTAGFLAEAALEGGQPAGLRPCDCPPQLA